MTFDEFRATLSDDTAPEGLDGAMTALWHAGRGDWEAKHKLAQAEKNRDGWWVHAYLHRVEGDLSNADYWYRRAGSERPQASLQAEWDAVTAALLARQAGG